MTTLKQALVQSFFILALLLNNASSFQSMLSNNVRLARVHCLALNQAQQPWFSHNHMQKDWLVEKKGVYKPKTALQLSSSFKEDASNSNIGGFDVDAVGKYLLALGVQMGIFYGLLTGIDKLIAKYQFNVPFAANVAFFYFFALKSRIFNPLSNDRPQLKTLEAKTNNNDRGINEDLPERKRPSWTPPNFVFPIMWLLIIAPLRAYTSAIIVGITGVYNNPATLAYFLHLSIGDLWNTVNNAERRNGVAALLVIGVWLSKAFVAYKYYQINERAGKLLGLTLIWLTIATALVVRIWQININPATGEPDPLLPRKGKVKTRFIWFR